MPLELSSFADKLRRYREQFDATIAEVSDATGITEATLIALEAATQRPTGDEVLILADYFKCDYKFFVSNEQLAPFEQTEKLFRKFGDEIAAADRWAIQEFLYLCECEAFLQSALGRPPPRAFSFTKTGSYFKGHGEQAALGLRRHLGYAAHEIPVDVFDDFRTIGVHVFRRHLDNSNISGLYVKHPTAGKCVLVNYSEDVYRQRFTAAHEAGHSILDDEDDFVVSFAKWEHSDLIEVRANTFAADFVLPPEYIQKMPTISWDRTTIVDAAQRLRINADALVFALQRAGRISTAEATSLKGLKVPRPSKLDPELPPSLTEKARARKEELLRRGLSTHYARLCFDAYENGHVSAGRLAEMMLTDENGLSEVGAIYGWSQKHGS
jgi:Zn-dependent peptidase ImmA (M78 family)/transcriptional regulator with XRE-family HTH domain